MKKLIIMLLVLVAVLTFAYCAGGGKNSEEENSIDNSLSETVSVKESSIDEPASNEDGNSESKSDGDIWIGPIPPKD